MHFHQTGEISTIDVGDINGDGYDDIALGTQIVNSDNIYYGFAQIYIIYGKANFTEYYSKAAPVDLSFLIFLEVQQKEWVVHMMTLFQ